MVLCYNLAIIFDLGKVGAMSFVGLFVTPNANQNYLKFSKNHWFPLKEQEK